jgi:hypothetical protein
MTNVCPWGIQSIPYFSQDLPFFSAAIGTPNLLQIALNLNILFEHSISDISARKQLYIILNVIISFLLFKH